jgi:hypothetical protein
VIESRIEETDPQETKYISLLSVVMFLTSVIVLAHSRFENDHMQYNADTGITDYTSTARFCVVRRLAINQKAYCGAIGTLKFESYSAN